MSHCEGKKIRYHIGLFLHSKLGPRSSWEPGTLNGCFAGPQAKQYKLSMYGAVILPGCYLSLKQYKYCSRSVCVDLRRCMAYPLAELWSGRSGPLMALAAHISGVTWTALGSKCKQLRSGRAAAETEKSMRYCQCITVICRASAKRHNSSA